MVRKFLLDAIWTLVTRPDHIFLLERMICHGKTLEQIAEEKKVSMSTVGLWSRIVATGLGCDGIRDVQVLVLDKADELANKMWRKKEVAET